MHHWTRGLAGKIIIVLTCQTFFSSWTDIAYPIDHLRPSNKAHRKAVADALGVPILSSARDGGVGEILDALRYGKIHHDAAVGKLVYLGRPKVSILLSVLHSRKDPEARVAIAEALGKIGGPRAVRGLLATVKNRNTNPDVRMAAIDALGEIGAPEAIPSLEEVSRSSGESWVISSAARDALAKISSDGEKKDPTEAKDGGVEEIVNGLLRSGIHYPQTVEVLLDMNLFTEDLIAALNSKTWIVRLVAVEVLGHRTEPNAISALQAALKDEDPRIQIAAKESLAKIAEAGSTEAEDGGNRVVILEGRNVEGHEAPLSGAFNQWRLGFKTIWTNP